jgi:DNA-binding XRE family transcriptional regulator
MSKKRLAPRYVLAANLKAMIEVNHTTAPRVAEKAGLDRKTINNMLNGRYNPNLDVVEAVAGVFGLNSWQMLRHDLPDSLVHAKIIDKLIDDFYAASPEDREKISGVAEMAAKYRNGNDK